MKYFWRMYRIVMVAMAVFGVVSCKALKPVAGGCDTHAAATSATNVNYADTTGSKQTTANVAKQVLSVLLHAEGSPTATQWSVQSVTTSAGVIKKGASKKMPGYETAYFVDAEGNRLDSAFFEQPLLRRIEAPGDDGKLATNMVQRTQGAAFVRANYKEEITELHIYNAAGIQTAALNLKKIQKK